MEARKSKGAQVMKKTGEELRNHSLLQNPFVVESPEKLSPEEILDLFVEEHSQVQAISQRKHTFVWGARGSGKSMVLRFLEPRCQSARHSGVEEYFARGDAYWGVYCPCKEGYFNKSDFEHMTQAATIVITEHLLNMYVVERVLTSLTNQLGEFLPNTETNRRLVKRVLALLDRVAIGASSDVANDLYCMEQTPLEWLRAFVQCEVTRVGHYLRGQSCGAEKKAWEGATSGYHDFLIPFLTLVRQSIGLGRLPFYLLIDDANRLLKSQQMVLNSWLGNRDHGVVCLKVAAEFEGYRTFQKASSIHMLSETSDGRFSIPREIRIESPHDYSEISIDELYTSSKTEYARKAALIVSRRLELAKLDQTDPHHFFPEDRTQSQLLEKMKEQTGKEWEKTGRPGKRDDYVYRLATARLFQHLRKTKQRRSYAGFHNIVHLSSGVLRLLLEPCWLMYARCLDQATGPIALSSIPPKIQDEVLFEYSEAALVQDMADIRKDITPDKYSRLESLATLLQSLGKLFYERLHDANAREARLFSFTVRGNVPESVESVLSLGVRYRYFMKRTYGTKEGGGREMWYVLNRRLCPVFKLDPTGFEGRISIRPEHLKIACQSPGQFVKLRLRKTGDYGEIGPLFSLVESPKRKTS